MISASSLKLYSCPRRWAIKAIGGIRESEDKFRASGVQNHRTLETWQKTGIEPTDAYDRALVQAFRPHLPEPGTALPEHAWAYSIDEVVFAGVIDLIDGSRKIDYKFCSSFKYTVDLMTDVAAMLYVLAKPSADTTELVWLYCNRKTLEIRPVKAEVTRQYAEDFVRREVLPTAKRMTEVLNRKAEGFPLIIEQPKDFSVCWSFGQPCPYHKLCATY